MRSPPPSSDAQQGRNAIEAIDEMIGCARLQSIQLDQPVADPDAGRPDRAGRQDVVGRITHHPRRGSLDAEFVEREKATREAGTKMIFPLPSIEVID